MNLQTILLLSGAVSLVACSARTDRSASSVSASKSFITPLGYYECSGLTELGIKYKVEGTFGNEGELNGINRLSGIKEVFRKESTTALKKINSARLSYSIPEKYALPAYKGKTISGDLKFSMVAGNKQYWKNARGTLSFIFDLQAFTFDTELVAPTLKRTHGFQGLDGEKANSVKLTSSTSEYLRPKCTVKSNPASAQDFFYALRCKGKGESLSYEMRLFSRLSFQKKEYAMSFPSAAIAVTAGPKSYGPFQLDKSKGTYFKSPEFSDIQVNLIAQPPSVTMTHHVLSSTASTARVAKPVSMTCEKSNRVGLHYEPKTFVEAQAKCFQWTAKSGLEAVTLTDKNGKKFKIDTNTKFKEPRLYYLAERKMELGKEYFYVRVDSSWSMSSGLEGFIAKDQVDYLAKGECPNGLLR